MAEVFFVQSYMTEKIKTAGVGVGPARCRAHFVNAAFIIFLQEETWTLIEYPITVFINSDISVVKFTGTHTEVLGDAF